MAKRSGRTGTRVVLSALMKNGSVLLLFEMLYRALGAAVLYPAVHAVLSALPRLAGQGFLGQENLGRVLGSLPAVLALAAVLLALGLFVCFELTALVLYGEAGYHGERLTLRALTVRAAKRTASLLAPRRLAVLLMLPAMALSVFALLGSSLQAVRVPEFILDFLRERPPLHFLFGALVAGLCALVFLYLPGFPALVLTGCSFPESWRTGLRLLRGKKLRALAALAAAMLGYLLSLLLVTLGLAGLAAAGVRLRFGASGGADYLRLLGAWAGVWRVAAGAFLSACLLTGATVLYHRLRGDVRPAPERAERTARSRLLRAARLAAVALLLPLFSESELGGAAYYPHSPETIVVAHRAGAAFAPENTVAALRLAAEHGASMAEIDVQQLRDGALVALHDTNFRRTTGVDLNVWDATLAQVRALDAGASFSYAYAGEPVPELSQMLEAAKGRIRLMIELKATGREQNLVEATLGEIDRFGMRDECVIASMNLDLLRRVKALAPDVQTAYISVLLLSEQYDLADIDAYSVETTSLTGEFVAEAHFQGKQVYAWTANTERNMLKIVRMQADGLVTDNPLFADYCLSNAGRDLSIESLRDLFFPESL